MQQSIDFDAVKHTKENVRMIVAANTQTNCRSEDQFSVPFVLHEPFPVLELVVHHDGPALCKPGSMDLVRIFANFL